MFYEKKEFKALKKKTARECMLCFGKCSGHKGIDEKEPVSILIAREGIFLERAKGADAIILMEQVQAYKQTDSAIVLKTTDPEAKKLRLVIGNALHRSKGCKLLEKYIAPQVPVREK